LSLNLIGQSVSDSSLAFPFSNSQTGGLFLNNPSNVNLSVEYDPITRNYTVQKKIGNLNYGIPKIYSFSQYQKYIQKKSVREYWTLRSRQRSEGQLSALGLPKLFIPGKSFDRVFGGSAVDIRTQGSAELIF